MVGGGKEDAYVKVHEEHAVVEGGRSEDDLLEQEEAGAVEYGDHGGNDVVCVDEEGLLEREGNEEGAAIEGGFENDLDDLLEKEVTDDAEHEGHAGAVDGDHVVEDADDKDGIDAAVEGRVVIEAL